MTPSPELEAVLQWTLPQWAMALVAGALFLAVVLAWRSRGALGRVPEVLLLVPAVAALGFAAMGPVQVGTRNAAKPRGAFKRAQSGKSSESSRLGKFLRLSPSKPLILSTM